MALGFVEPSRSVFSGVVLGLVVAVTNGFETLTGIRPAYELYNHSWTHDLRWLLLILPAMASSLLGKKVALKLLDRPHG